MGRLRTESDARLLKRFAPHFGFVYLAVGEKNASSPTLETSS